MMTDNRKRKSHLKWDEYVRDSLLHDEGKSTTRKNVERLEILKSQVKSALNKINRNKATGRVNNA